MIPDIIIISAKKKQTFVLGFWERSAISASQVYILFESQHTFVFFRFASLSSPVSSTTSIAKDWEGVPTCCSSLYPIYSYFNLKYYFCHYLRNLMLFWTWLWQKEIFCVWNMNNSLDTVFHASFWKDWKAPLKYHKSSRYNGCAIFCTFSKTIMIAFCGKTEI